MDVIAFFKGLIEDWQLETKCGFCWKFGAPLEESAVNQQQPEDDSAACCVHVLISDIAIAQQRTYASTGYQDSRADNHSFILYVMRKDSVGKNNYNEIAGHPIPESKWEETLNPLKECLEPEGLLPFCETLGLNIQITNWQMSTKLNYLDGNYTGWMIRATLKETIQ